MSIKHLTEYIFFVSISRIVGLFGIGNVKYFAKPIAFLFYYFIPIRKAVVKKNISKAFPKLAQKEINDLAFRNYYSLAITFLEIMCFRYSTKEQILSIIEKGDVILAQNALAKNKGAILLTAHFGNWELGAISIGLLLNFPVHVLAKKQKNLLVANWMKRIREKFGNKEILLGASLRDLYVTLKNGGAIGVVGDQRGPKESLRVDFFNQPTAVFSGTAALALKNKVPIIVTIIVRNTNHRYEIETEEISLENLSGSKEEQIKELNQRYFRILERNIIEHPEQWFWMHNIWKY